MLTHRARELGLPIALVILVIYFSMSSDVFLTGQNMRNVALQAAALAAVAVGQTFVILNSDLDLSVGSTVALVSVVGGMQTIPGPSGWTGDHGEGCTTRGRPRRHT